MSHKKGTGLEQVLEQALGLLHDKLLKEQFGVGRRRRKSKKTVARAKPTAAAESTGVDAPSAGSGADGASVPVAVRAEVYQRDGGACTYVDPETRQRCGERRWLQLDHIVPRCRGGMSTTTNLRCLCGPHNRLMAREILGDAFMEQKLTRAADGDRRHPR